MIHQCPTCNQVFSQKAHLIAHFKRKRPCSQVDNSGVLARLDEITTEFRQEIDNIKKLVSALEKAVNTKIQQPVAEVSKYQHGKVYRICDNLGQIYIGSTIISLDRRLSLHKKSYKRWQQGLEDYCTSYEVLKSGINGIFLLEVYPCETKQQLLEREKYNIQQTPNCVNKYTPIK